MVQPTSDGYPHHWSQGPRNLVRLYAPIDYPPARWEWQYCWMLENPEAVAGATPAEIAFWVNYILNIHEKGWHRSGVHFTEVKDMAKAHIMLRFTDAPPPDWPDLPWSAGWAYYDRRIGKRVAQITPAYVYFGRTMHTILPVYSYILNMELAGHGTFDMYDMYPEIHQPYSGSMGGALQAIASQGMPSDLEIESAKAWLRGEAIHVHAHPSLGSIEGADDMPAPGHQHGDEMPMAPPDEDE